MTIYLREKSADFYSYRARSLGYLLGRAPAYGAAASLSGCLQILPIVEEWPYANDINGQAYPAGLVGVRQAFTLGASVDPATVSGAVADFPIPVPSVLPEGYTHRWKRDHMWTPGVWDPTLGQGILGPASHDFTGVSATSMSHRIRQGDGLHDYFYVPECRNNGYDSGYGGLATSTWSHVPIAGWDYIQFGYHWPDGNGWTTYYSPVPHVEVEVRCNADGSNGAPGNGDTLLATWVSSPADDDAEELSSVFTTDLQFPLGERRWVQIRPRLFDEAGPGIITTNFATRLMPGIRIRARARTDLALLFTATGTGSLIAPGGIVESVLDQALPT